MNKMLRESRDKVMTFKVSASEVALISALKKQMGVSTQSDVLRLALDYYVSSNFVQNNDLRKIKTSKIY